MSIMPEPEFLKIMLRNIEMARGVINDQRVKLEQQEETLRGYEQAFRNRLSSITGDGK